MSHAARSERPMRRWISTVRPLCLPLAASRSMRSGEAPGSMEYSAVTQPLPVPFIQRGTLSSIEFTRVGQVLRKAGYLDLTWNLLRRKGVDFFNGTRVIPSPVT